MNVLLNYASPGYEALQRASSRTATAFGGFDRVAECSSADLDPAFRHRNAAIVDQPRGAGYWLWKACLWRPFDVRLHARAPKAAVAMRGLHKAAPRAVPVRHRRGPRPSTRGVSILVPVRDEARFVGAALGSLATQDYGGPMETIMADASKGAATAGAARAALPGVRIVANPGRTAAAGMNRALGAASFDIVARCDARCTLPPDYLRRAVATLEATGAANVGGRLEIAGHTPFERATALAMRSRLGSGGPRYRSGGPAGPVESVPLGVFRRGALEAVGGFDETLARNEDYEVNARLRAAGELVLFDPGLAVVYRPRPDARSLARQYYDYGRWKRVVVRRHPRSLRTRQVAPPALVLGLLASFGCAGAAALAPTGGAMLAGLAALLPAAWLIALAAAALGCAARLRGVAALAMAWPLAIMHLAWGAGFLVPVPPRTARERPAPGSRPAPS